jgi:hypothetical protein
MITEMKGMVMSRRLPYVATFVAILAIAVWLASPDIPLSTARTRQSQDHIAGKPVQVFLFYELGTPLDTAMVSLPMRIDISEPLLFTLYFDINEDGIFEDAEKAVDEVAAFGEKGVPNSFPILFANGAMIDLLITNESKKVQVKVIVTSSDDLNPPQTVQSFETMATKRRWDIDDIFSANPGFVGGGGRTLASIFDPSLAYAQGGAINIFNEKVPDQPARSGKKNECVPIAMANSLLWLATKHGFEKSLPAKTNDLLDELDQDLQYTDKGVKQENILPGKIQFTADRGLELNNKRIDATLTEGRSDIWDKIVEELRAGEDVELIFDLKETPTSDATGSHAVTVVGASNKGGKQYIIVHDPVTPKGNDSYQVLRNGQIQGHPLGKGFGMFIISESFEKRT